MAYVTDLKSVEGNPHAGSSPATPILKVYGPYKRGDGRKHVILWDGKRHTPYLTLDI
jgi:hypothetical protein